MSRIFWVRHGPTHEKAFVGHRDVPADLSDTAALTRLSAALPMDAPIVSSDLLRTRQTARAIANGRPLLPPQRALREFDFGVWDGMHWSDVAKTWPDLSRAYWEEPGDVAPPDGESWNAAAGRINAAVDKLIEVHSGPVIVVAHFGVILTQVQRALGSSAYEALSHRIDPLSLTEISVTSPWRLGRVNHIA